MVIGNVIVSINFQLPITKLPMTAYDNVGGSVGGKGLWRGFGTADIR